MEQEGIVAILLGRDANLYPLAPTVVFILGFGALQPRFGREWRIGYDIVESLQLVFFLELRVVDGVALLDVGIDFAMKNHVHLSQAYSGIVFLLPIDGGTLGSLTHGTQEERARPTCGVVDGGSPSVLGFGQSYNLSHHTTDLGRSIELPFALSTLGGKVLHQILIGITDEVVIGSAVLAEVKIVILEYGNKIAERVDFVFSLSQFRVILEVCHEDSFKLVGLGKGSHLLVHLFANVGLALESDEVFKKASLRNVNIKTIIATTLVADVFHEENHQHIILVLACIHTATKFIAAFPQRTI